MTIDVEVNRRPKSIKLIIAQLMLRWLRDSVKTIDEEVAEECFLLDNDILQRELVLIDHEMWVEGQRRKKAFLVDWLDRRNKT